MGCRKNAYRALTEMSEWMEEQQAAAAATHKVWLREQQQYWTSTTSADAQNTALFDTICPQWLANGPERATRRHDTVSSQQRGCSGGCGRAHPRIVLVYDNAVSGCRAIVSHGLNPLVRYTDQLCQEGRANRSEVGTTGGLGFVEENIVYQLTGFIEEHMAALQSSGLASHLVKVSPRSVSASRRAHEKLIEEQTTLERTKRRKLCKTSRDGTADLVLETAMELLAPLLLDHLDVAEIAWMRLTGSPPFIRAAARMATARLQSVCMAYSIKVGDVAVGEHLPLTTPTPSGALHPVERIPFTVESPASPVVHVFILPPSTHPHPLPEEDVLFKSPVEIARYPIDLSYAGTASSGISYTTMQDEASRSFTIDSIPGFDFRHLLGTYARKRLPEAKQHLLDIKAKRPATITEKEYVRALAKEARNAPRPL